MASEPPPSTATPEKLRFIDSLRGLAALMVVVCHVGFIPSPALDTNPVVQRLIYSGQTGVVLFFIISAFTLCLSCEVRQIRFTSRQTLDFYLRRLFRILPLYLASIPIAWFRDFFVYGYSRPIGDVLASSFAIFIPNERWGIVWASWTLGVELLFYLLFPLFFQICRTLPRALLCLVASVAADIIGSTHMVSYANTVVPGTMPQVHDQVRTLVEADIRFSLLHNLQFFLLGIVFYFLYRDVVRRRRLRNSQASLLTTCGALGFVALVLLYPQALGVLYGRHLLIGLCFFMVVLGCSSYSSGFIVNRVFVFMGVISYSLYLLHPPLVALLEKAFRGLYGLGLPLTFSYMLCLGLVLLLLVPASILAYRYIEKPGISLGRMVAKRL